MWREKTSSCFVSFRNTAVYPIFKFISLGRKKPLSFGLYWKRVLFDSIHVVCPETVWTGHAMESVHDWFLAFNILNSSLICFIHKLPRAKYTVKPKTSGSRQVLFVFPSFRCLLHQLIFPLLSLPDSYFPLDAQRGC